MCLEGGDTGVFRLTTGSPSLHWLLDHARGFDVDIEDVSMHLAALAIQGPTSRDCLAACAEGDVDRLRFFRVMTSRIGDVPVEISRTGYTGDLGYEVWIPAARALEVWDAITETGAGYGLCPVGLDALDMTRVEAGFVLQDVDYTSALRATIESRKSTPAEIGLASTVDLGDDREPFIGREALSAERARGPKWNLVGLDIDWEETEALFDKVGLPPELPSHAWRDPVPVYHGGMQVGYATSGTWSPILKRNLALATVEARFGNIGRRLMIEHTVEYRRERVRARVVETPFFDPNRKRAVPEIA